MKAAIEVMRNKLQRVHSFQHTTNKTIALQRSSSEPIKTKLDRKKILQCEVENDLAKHCLLMERKIFGVTMADVMHLAYQLAARNRIKNQFCKRNGKAGSK